MRWSRRGPAGVLALALLASCERAGPPLRERPPDHRPPVLEVQTSGLQAGPARPEVAMRNPYAGNAWALREGERLYGWFNCDGCHGAQGGGGIGPPFADDDWIYGGEPGSIFQSIVQGRPEGMPAFGGKIPATEVWKIVSYVRSLAGHGLEPPTPEGPPASEAPGRREAPEPGEAQPGEGQGGEGESG